MNKNITLASVAEWAAPSCSIKWTGYIGAIPSDEPKLIVSRANGDTIVTTSLGESYNCHPKVKSCGMSYEDPGYKEGPYIVYEPGVYPIRFKII